MKNMGRFVIVLALCSQASAQEKAVLGKARVVPFSERRLTEDPPVVESATLQLSNAVQEIDAKSPEVEATLNVQFAKEGLPSQMMIHAGAKRSLLRDDGDLGDAKSADGTFTGPITINLAQLRELAARQAQAKEIPLFEGRSLVKRREPFTPLDIEGLLQGKPIKIPVPFPGITATPVDPARSLMITDLSVVEDPTRTFNPCSNVGTPMGKWTFGYLMTQMANESQSGIDPSTFVRRWLKKWEFDQNVNDWSVKERKDMIRTKIIEPWQAKSGAGMPLDLSKAPFRLLAIVNRIDLRDNVTYGGGSGGEARFVFCALDENCNPLQFTVIFEYGIQVKNCNDLKAWGQQWANLTSLPLGSPGFNPALEAITEQFAKAGANPSQPNGSALNQLRANEFALNLPWELREFKLFDNDSDAGHLREVTVKQTPDLSLNGTQLLADFINSNESAVLLEKHQVPLDFPAGGDHFVGGSALTDPGMIWNAAGIANPKARHKFSLNTCNGCHAGETNTFFTHVKPGPFGSPVGLSGFLTGVDATSMGMPPFIFVADPTMTGNPPEKFNDLERRRISLETLLSTPCFFEMFRQPLRATH